MTEARLVGHCFPLHGSVQKNFVAAASDWMDDVSHCSFSDRVLRHQCTSGVPTETHAARVSTEQSEVFPHCLRVKQMDTNQKMCSSCELFVSFPWTQQCGIIQGQRTIFLFPTCSEHLSLHFRRTDNSNNFSCYFPCVCATPHPFFFFRNHLRIFCCLLK